NASYRAMLAAAEDVRAEGALPVPLHLRNAPTPLMKGLGYGQGYRYPHDYDEAVVEQDYLPDRLAGRRYYEPSDRGQERAIADRLRPRRRRAPRPPPDCPPPPLAIQEQARCQRRAAPAAGHRVQRPHAAERAVTGGTPQPPRRRPCDVRRPAAR